MSPVNHTINYIELPMKDNDMTKRFYSSMFGWTFTDWGPDYISFSGAGIEGGFHGGEDTKITAPGVLVVLYADRLEATEAAIREAGGTIVKPIFSFPGGRRFHFHDPNGNELAVWSDK